MKFKRESRPTSSKSKSAYLDKKKLKKILKEQGISSLEARTVLNSGLSSRERLSNGRRHRESRRLAEYSIPKSSSYLNLSSSSKSQERQPNGRKHKRCRIEKRKKSKIHRRHKELRSSSPKNSKLYNGHRRKSASSSSKKKKRSESHNKKHKETEASKLIRKMLESKASDTDSSIDDNETRRKEDVKKEPKVKRCKYIDTPNCSAKRRKYTGSFSEYLFEHLNNSLDSSSTSSLSDDDSLSSNEESQPEPDIASESTIDLDSDNEEHANAEDVHMNFRLSESPLLAPKMLYHDRKKKKLRPPKLMRKLNPPLLHTNYHERNKTKRNASQFLVTEVDSMPTSSNNPLSPNKRDISRRLALVKYNPRQFKNLENLENCDNDEELSNISDKDDFSDYKNEDRDDNRGQNEGDDSPGERDYSSEINGEGEGVRTLLNGDNLRFNSDDDNAQLIDLVIEAEETIEFAPNENEVHVNEYVDTSPGHTFPIKVFEASSDSFTRPSIADIMLRMSQQVITTSIDATEPIDGPNQLDAMEAETEMGNKSVEQNIPGILASEYSSISMDDEEIENASVQSEQNETLIEENFIDEQTTSRKPIFINSSNSKQVLMIVTGRIYFHGALSIRLLAGHANIFGYELEINKTVTANSPRGHSFLYLSPSVQNHTDNEDNVPFYLKNELSHAFLSTDLDEVLTNFDCSKDAIVLLEHDSTNRSILMIEKYMKQNLFPNMNSFNNRDTSSHTESILHCQFMRRTVAGLTINPQWQDISMKSSSRQVIIGGKGVGKSTLLRYIVNKNLKEFERILLIDLDIGQPELFLPQTVSATVLTEPILGPGYLQNKIPHKSYLFGDINVLVSPIKYLKCVLKLLKYCNSSDELKTIPWVINTMGYNRGFGLELIVAILRALNPTDLIQIQSKKSTDNFEKILNVEEVNEFCLNIFKDEVEDMQNDCCYETYVCNTMAKGERKKVWDISPKDLRFAMVLTKLGNILRENINANWLTDVKPMCASLDDLKIIVISDDCVGPHLQPNIINGSLVYLCQRSDNDDEDILECHGIGVVRGVDTGSNKVYLLPSISNSELQNVNALVVCSIPLPTQILINQSSKINGRVPFVYRTENFIGSKQVVPISYRPGKRTSINSHI